MQETDCEYCGKEVKPTDFSIEHQLESGKREVFCDESCFTKHHDEKRCPDLKSS